MMVDAIGNRVEWPAFLWYSGPGPVSLIFVGLLVSTDRDLPEQDPFGDDAPLVTSSEAS
jgi:hypothetical protein